MLNGKRLVIALLCIILLVISTFLSATALAGLDPKITKITPLSHPIFKKFDADFIANDIKNVKTINKNDLIIIKNLSLDYSPYLTHTQNQDGWGGCIGRSILHAMDILNEREHPYTPDLSFWYLHIRQEQLAAGGPVNTKNLLEKYGLCSETTLPSDYDKGKWVGDHWDWSGMPQPNAQIDGEAGFYKVKCFSDPLAPSVDGIKSLLVKYGPILGEGPMVKLLGPNPPEGHCITIVGYSEITRTFRCLNSWGDTWSGNGFFTLGYDELTENISAVRYIEDGPSDRTGTNFAYSARVWIVGHGISRNKLAVKIGVDGKTPMTVWDTPGEVNCVDGSQTLCIDFALPAYAANCWPPKNKQWYVEVYNAGSGSGTFEVKELTLAKLSKDSGGAFITRKYNYTPAGINVAAQVKQKIYIPVTQIIVKDGLIDEPLKPVN